MLSRVANSLYWMCRYIERTENVARFIDVNLNLLLDTQASRQEDQWAPLILTSGDQDLYEELGGDYSEESVIRFLTFERKYPNSIMSCIMAARENARSIREVISSEMWEHLNHFYLELKTKEHRRMAFSEPDRFFTTIKMRSHLFNGLMDATMSHDDAWNFTRSGLLLERADKTSRILDVKYFMLLPRVELVNTPLDNIQWGAVLHSNSALEAYRREKQQIVPDKVVEFLIFNKRFPRSIYYCVGKLQQHIHRLYGNANSGARHPPLEKELGRLMADLEYTEIDEVIAKGLHEFLDDLQCRLNLIDTQIAATFFNIEPSANGQSAEQ